MKKRLLIGPAGSGKTRTLLDDFHHEFSVSENLLDDTFYFVLPSAEHTERIITQTLQKGIKGFFNERVTTLSSLLTRTFSVSDQNVATNVTRYLFLKQVLDARPEGYYGAVAHTHGFLNRMLALITELKEARVSVTDFRERMNAMKSVEPELAPKYEYLAGIYEGYQETLTHHGLRDRQDAFDLYLKNKKTAHLSAGQSMPFRKIWMDGFFDFSPLQLAYLNELAGMTGEMTITLTMDPGASRAELFEPIAKTKDALEGMGFEVVHVPAAKEPAPLRFLERHLFSSKLPEKRPDAGTSLAVFDAVGMEGEIEMIARTILHMVKRSERRLSDFAVLFRRIGGYESVIRSVFSRYGLPVEIHERERLGFSPMMHVIVTLLKVYQSEWQRHTLMDFLKSAYVRSDGEKEKDAEWVHWLEYASVEKNVYLHQERWLELASENASPSGRILVALADLEEDLRAAKTYPEIKNRFKHAVSGIFQIYRPSKTADDYAKRDAATFRRFESILDEIERSFPDTGHCEPRRGEAISDTPVGQAGIASSEMGHSPRNDSIFDTFCERFFRLADIDLYSLRETNKNKVQVYDVSLARQKEYEVVFISGLLEKQFPVQMREDPVLSDWERRLFNGSEMVLQEKLSRQTMERYLFYLACTRAKEKLFLTYPRLDLNGKESLPSYYVDEVKRLFGEPVTVRYQNLSRPYPEWTEAGDRRELELAVVGSLWNAPQKGSAQDPLLHALTHYLLNDASSTEKLRQVFYQIRDEITDPAILARNPFRPTFLSPSKLEAYGKCPFHYFARYVLQLNDPEEDLNIKVRGTVLHQVLEECFIDWVQKPAVMKDAEKAKQEARKKLDEVVREHPILKERQYQYDLEIVQMQETLDRFIETELERLRTAKLQPKYFEYPFGTEEAQSKALKLHFDSHDVRIRGVIDRIDMDAKGEVAAVMDYKRKAVFNRTAMDLGTALQLPIYTLVAEEALGCRVISAELYSVVDAKKNGFYRDAFSEKIDKKKSRWTLHLEESEFQALLGKSLQYIEHYTREMAAAKMAAAPRDKVHCEMFCAYGAVCRIQKWKLPMMMEDLKKKVIASPARGEAI